MAAWLRDRIIEGELAPGARVPERAVCERLGISRTPLREAFKTLAAERLLTLERNKGAIVTPVTARDVEDAMRLMAELEGFAGELACENILPGEIETLRRLHGELEELFERRDLLTYFKVNQQIHETIVTSTRNGMLCELYLGLVKRFARFRYAGNKTEDRWRRAILEHRHIMVALEERDGPLLRQLLRAHVQSGWKVARDAVGIAPGEAG